MKLLRQNQVLRLCTLITSYPSGEGIQVLQIVCIDARLQLDGYIVSPSTCMKQGIGNDSSDRNFNFQQEVVIPTQLLKICYNNEQVL